MLAILTHDLGFPQNCVDGEFAAMTPMFLENFLIVVVVVAVQVALVGPRESVFSSRAPSSL